MRAAGVPGASQGPSPDTWLTELQPLPPLRAEHSPALGSAHFLFTQP